MQPESAKMRRRPFRARLRATGLLTCLALLFAPRALPAAPAGGHEPNARARMLETVAALSDAWTNRGRGWALKERIEALGLTPYLKVEWIDWFTHHDNYLIEIPAPNAGPDTPIVYVTAHWDKVDLNPLAAVSLYLNGALDDLVSWSYFSDGAVDNATGVALALELARHFASDPGRKTLRVLLTGAEEMGLRGARAHMARLTSEEAARVSFTLNLDTLARAGTDDCVLADVSDAQLSHRMLYAARDAGVPINVGKIPFGASSDHAAFAHTSFWYDFGRGILYNMPGGLLPQRSWFTSAKDTRVVVLGGCELADWSDYLAGTILLPVGSIHGPRDSEDDIDAGALEARAGMLKLFLKRAD